MADDGVRSLKKLPPDNEGTMETRGVGCYIGDLEQIESHIRAFGEGI